MAEEADDDWRSANGQLRAISPRSLMGGQWGVPAVGEGEAGVKEHRAQRLTYPKPSPILGNTDTNRGRLHALRDLKLGSRSRVQAEESPELQRQISDKTGAACLQGGEEKWGRRGQRRSPRPPSWAAGGALPRGRVEAQEQLRVTSAACRKAAG